MTHIYPLMKEKFATIEHVSFFVELTTISSESSRPEFQNLFAFLCLDEKIDPRFVTFIWNVCNCLSRFHFFYLLYRLSLKYLAQLFESRQFLVNISLSVDNYQTILIQSWFR